MQGREQMFQLMVGNLWLHGLNYFNSGRTYRQSEHYIFQLVYKKLGKFICKDQPLLNYFVGSDISFQTPR